MKTWAKWIEIPATELERARQFYQSIFQVDIQILDLGGLKMGLFPQAEVGVALCENPAYQPSATQGVLVYLNAGPDLDEVLGRVEAGGGKILRPKTFIAPGRGYMALFVDTEGNRLALHSEN